LIPREANFMQRIDTLIGILLVAAIVGSAAGVLLYDASEGAQFDVSFQTSTTGMDLDAQSRNGPGRLTFTFNVTEANLTSMHFAGTLTAPGPRVTASSVLVTITAPDGTTTTQDASLPAGAAQTVEVDIEVPVIEVPANTTQRGVDGDAAIAAVGAASTAGQGTWIIDIDFGSAAPVAQLDTSARSASWHIEAITYHAVATPHVPEIQR
jgi:hypothetical protein